MSNSNTTDNRACIIDPVRPPTDGIPVQFFMTATGDNVPPYNLNGNYSAAPQDFYYQATANYDIYSVLINISDNANFNQLDYGAIVDGTITHGPKFFIKPNGLTEIPLLSGMTIIHNYDWLSLTPEVALTSFAGLAQTLTININMMNQYGQPLSIRKGDRFIIRLNDNFSTLVSQTFVIRGIRY